jgi:hypothetical protein
MLHNGASVTFWNAIDFSPPIRTPDAGSRDPSSETPDSASVSPPPALRSRDGLLIGTEIANPQAEEDFFPED